MGRFPEVTTPVDEQERVSNPNRQPEQTDQKRGPETLSFSRKVTPNVENLLLRDLSRKKGGLYMVKAFLVIKRRFAYQRANVVVLT